MSPDFNLADLRSVSSRRRLEAVRALLESNDNVDQDLVDELLEHESNRWVRRLLEDVQLQRRGRRPARRTTRSAATYGAAFADQVRAAITEQVTRQVLHEFQPVLGRLRQQGEIELASYAKSPLKATLDRFERLLVGFESLHLASRSPSSIEFDLASVVELVARDEASARGTSLAVTTTLSDIEPAPNAVPSQLDGRSPLIVVGDPNLVELGLRQGCRNAIEAMEQDDGIRPGMVTFLWDSSAGGNRVSILDDGAGLPLGADQAFVLGRSSKPKDMHQGLGLPIARQAARALDGDVSLIPRAQGGANFEFRWPQSR